MSTFFEDYSILVSYTIPLTSNLYKILALLFAFDCIHPITLFTLLLSFCTNIVNSCSCWSWWRSITSLTNYLSTAAIATTCELWRYKVCGWLTKEQEKSDDGLGISAFLLLAPFELLLLIIYYFNYRIIKWIKINAINCIIIL